MLMWAGYMHAVSIFAHLLPELAALPTTQVARHHAYGADDPHMVSTLIAVLSFAWIPDLIERSYFYLVTNYFYAPRLANGVWYALPFADFEC